MALMSMLFAAFLIATLCDHRAGRGAVMRAIARIGALTALGILGTAAAAAAADVRIYCSGAPAPAVQAIAADFTAQTGHHLTFIIGQPATIAGDLSAGAKADLVILPAPVVARLKTSGTLRADSAVDVARVGIGVAIRSGAQAPDVSSVASIRQLLLDAHSIVYPDPLEPGGGSAGHAIAQMIERMGIADSVRPKLTLTTAIGGGVALVAAGKAEIGLFNTSEILPVSGAALAGPLPAELQTYIVFDAAIPADAAAPAPAASFITMLAAPAERPAWQKAGLEPLGGTQAQ
jgi:molybdate transport system substrate-binding protein